MTYRTPDLRIIEDVFGGCMIVGPQADRDLPHQHSFLGPVNPFNPRFTRKEAEMLLGEMQQIEDASLLGLPLPTNPLDGTRLWNNS